MAKWLLISLAVILVALTRLIPADYRLLNFTAVGALALFVAARVGLWQSLAITAAAMMTSDAIQLWQHHGDTMYLPFAATYAALAIYAVLGYWMIGRSGNPLVIGGAALSASGLFFFTTNFASWLSPIHGYERSLAGLLTCYEAALPFYRGTLFGDLAFTAVMFGAHAVLTRAVRQPATVSDEIVSGI